MSEKKDNYLQIRRSRVVNHAGYVREEDEYSTNSDDLYITNKELVDSLGKQPGDNLRRGQRADGILLPALKEADAGQRHTAILVDAVLAAPGQAIGIPHPVQAAQGGFVVIQDLGLTAMIGKGERNQAVVDAMQKTLN